MSDLPCGCILMSNVISVDKKMFEENGMTQKTIWMNHIYHHLVDASGNNGRKTELFSQGEN